MKTWREALSKRGIRILKTMSLWIFNDVIYAVLPLIVIAILTRVLNRGFNEFLLLKEWSFASIVLYGVAIRNAIQEEQRSKNKQDTSHSISPFLNPDAYTRTPDFQTRNT